MPNPRHLSNGADGHTELPLLSGIEADTCQASKQAAERGIPQLSAVSLTRGYTARKPIRLAGCDDADHSRGNDLDFACGVSR